MGGGKRKGGCANKTTDRKSFGEALNGQTARQAKKGRRLRIIQARTLQNAEIILKKQVHKEVNNAKQALCDLQEDRL